MKTKELRGLVGKDVWVVLPYSGGMGWAKVIDADAEPEPRRPGSTVRIAFYEGEVYPYYDGGVKLVRPADILHAGEYPGPRVRRETPLETALKALKEFGDHRWNCACQDLKSPCDCGFDAAVETLEVAVASG